MAQAGKLTAPSKTRTALQQKQALDEAKNSLHESDLLRTNLELPVPAPVLVAAP